MATSAYLDESLRSRGSGLLLLAAVVVPDHDAECRTGMRRLRLAGQRRIHWRDESPERRDHIVAAVASLPWTAAAAAIEPAARRLHRRARAECLSTIVARLAAEAVGSLIIESRGAHNDREDRGTLIECGRAGHSVETYGFARAVDEPLL